MKDGAATRVIVGKSGREKHTKRKKEECLLHASDEVRRWGFYSNDARLCGGVGTASSSERGGCCLWETTQYKYYSKSAQV
jgi:hypothetical protein